MKIGIIGSSGGAVFQAVVKILSENSAQKHEYFVVVDRACALHQYCLSQAINVLKVEQSSNQLFSTESQKYFKQCNGIHVIFLFYSRLITSELFDYFPIVNLHPSLLPKYKGFHAIEQALSANESELGATLHVVDRRVDGGEVIAQISTPSSEYEHRNIEKAFTVSYLQKVWLMLALIDSLECHSGHLAEVKKQNVSLINSSYLAAFDKLQNQEQLKIR